MRNLDIDSRFTNIPLDENLEISPKVLFKSSNIVHGLKKSEFIEYKPSYNRRYVDDIFILFKSSYHLKRFQSHLNSCHVNRTTK